MAKDHNNGSFLEGFTTVIGGLFKQATNGDVDHITKTVTNEPDGGVDYIRSVKDSFDYFSFLRQLKGKDE